MPHDYEERWLASLADEDEMKLDAEEGVTESRAMKASIFARPKPKPKKFSIIRTTKFLDAKDGSRQFEITSNSALETVEFAIINGDGSTSCVAVPWDEAGSIASALFV